MGSRPQESLPVISLGNSAAVLAPTCSRPSRAFAGGIANLIEAERGDPAGGHRRRGYGRGF